MKFDLKSPSKFSSLANINCKSVAGILKYKAAGNCAVRITGGTEVGHSTSTPQSHSNSFKLDISVSSCNDKYISSNFKNIGVRSDGADLYQDSFGNVYAREGDHWDIKFP